MIRQGKSWSHVLEPTWCVPASSCWQPLPEWTHPTALKSVLSKHFTVECILRWSRNRTLGPFCKKALQEEGEENDEEEEEEGNILVRKVYPFRNQCAKLHFDPSECKCMYCICEPNSSPNHPSFSYLLVISRVVDTLRPAVITPTSIHHLLMTWRHLGIYCCHDLFRFSVNSWKSRTSKNWPYLLKGDKQIQVKQIWNRKRKHHDSQTRHIIALLLLLIALMWLASTQDWCHCSGGMKIDFGPISLPHTSLVEGNSTATTNISLQRPLKSCHNEDLPTWTVFRYQTNRAHMLCILYYTPLSLKKNTSKDRSSHTMPHLH